MLSKTRNKTCKWGPQCITYPHKTNSAVSSLSGSAVETAGRGSEDIHTDWETDGQMKRSRCEWKKRETQSRGVGLNQDSRQQSDPPRHTADICKSPASGCLWSKHTHTHIHTHSLSLKTPHHLTHTRHLHPYCPTHPTPSLGSIRAGWLLPSRVKPTDLNDLHKQPLPLSSKPHPPFMSTKCLYV